MLRHIALKLISILVVSLTITGVIGRFSPNAPVYSGFAAAFLGTVCLLAGWLSYLKSKGTDMLGRMKRTPPPPVPYIHQPGKTVKPTIGLGGPQHTYDDDLAELATGADEEAPLPLLLRQKLDAAAYVIAGLLLLVLSLY